MIDCGELVFESRPRRRHALSEKRRIVELTFQPGASVAQVARANGVNANQVVGWRRAVGRGGLVELAASPTALRPVAVSAAWKTPMRKPAEEEEPSSSGSIHIEFPGRALLSVECGA